MTSSMHAISATPSISARSRQASHAQGLGSLLRSWWDAYWAHRAQRATVLMLRSLDAHTLHDIGLDRSEIESVVYGRRGDRRLGYEHNWR